MSNPQALELPELPSHPLPLDIAAKEKKPRAKKTQSQARRQLESMTIRTLFSELRIDASALRQTVEDLGYLIKEPGKPWRLVKKSLPASQWLNWQAGANPVPRWRLAQILVVLELFKLDQQHNKLIDTAHAERVTERLRQAQQIKGVEAYINPFRLAVLRRLTLETKFGDLYRQRAEMYRKAIEPILRADESIFPKQGPR